MIYPFDFTLHLVVPAIFLVQLVSIRFQLNALHPFNFWTFFYCIILIFYSVQHYIQFPNVPSLWAIPFDFVLHLVGNSGWLYVLAHKHILLETNLSLWIPQLPSSDALSWLNTRVMTSMHFDCFNFIDLLTERRWRAILLQLWNDFRHIGNVNQIYSHVVVMS